MSDAILNKETMETKTPVYAPIPKKTEHHTYYKFNGHEHAVKCYEEGSFKITKTVDDSKAIDEKGVLIDERALKVVFFGEYSDWGVGRIQIVLDRNEMSTVVSAKSATTNYEYKMNKQEQDWHRKWLNILKPHLKEIREKYFKGCDDAVCYPEKLKFTPFGGVEEITYKEDGSQESKKIPYDIGKWLTLEGKPLLYIKNVWFFRGSHNQTQDHILMGISYGLNKNKSLSPEEEADRKAKNATKKEMEVSKKRKAADELEGTSTKK